MEALKEETTQFMGNQNNLEFTSLTRIGKTSVSGSTWPRLIVIYIHVFLFLVFENKCWDLWEKYLWILIWSKNPTIQHRHGKEYKEEDEQRSCNKTTAIIYTGDRSESLLDFSVKLFYTNCTYKLNSFWKCF